MTDTSRAPTALLISATSVRTTIDAANGIVVHHVIGASRADWVGTEQVRYYAFTPEGRLTLSLKQGDRITQTLTWERVASR